MLLQDGAGNEVILPARRLGTVRSRLPNTRLARPAIRANRPARLAHAARSFRRDRPVLCAGFVGGTGHWRTDQRRAHPNSVILAGARTRSSLKPPGCRRSTCRWADCFRASRRARRTTKVGRLPPDRLATDYGDRELRRKRAFAWSRAVGRVVNAICGRRKVRRDQRTDDAVVSHRCVGATTSCGRRDSTVDADALSRVIGVLPRWSGFSLRRGYSWRAVRRICVRGSTAWCCWYSRHCSRHCSRAVHLGNATLNRPPPASHAMQRTSPPCCSAI